MLSVDDPHHRAPHPSWLICFNRSSNRRQRRETYRPANRLSSKPANRYVVRDGKCRFPARLSPLRRPYRHWRKKQRSATDASQATGASLHIRFPDHSFPVCVLVSCAINSVRLQCVRITGRPFTGGMEILLPFDQRDAAMALANHILDEFECTLIIIAQYVADSGKSTLRFNTTWGMLFF